jgi:hypothetical protein
MYSQIDSSTIEKDSLRLDKNHHEKSNTSHKEIKHLSILQLKAMLGSQMNNLKLITPDKPAVEEEYLLYDFTKEELNSGLSKKELVAYRKNKDQFKQILMQNYDAGWLVPCKSIGEILGMPGLDWLIKALEFALLLAL